MDIETAIEDIYKLHELYDSIENTDKKKVMNTMFLDNITKFTQKMEESYYKKIIKNRSVTQLKNSHALEIERTQNTMNAFLPFIVAYNMNT